MPLYQPATRLATWDASDNTFLAWSCDPAVVAAAGATLATAGTIYGSRLWIPKPLTVATVTIQVLTAGATLTSGQCFAALYQNNNLLAATADQSVAWASTGTKGMALTASQSVTQGYVDVCMFFNGTTGPTLLHNTGTSSAINTNLSTTAIRSFTADTGRTTTMPASLAAKSAFTGNGIYWIGLS